MNSARMVLATLETRRRRYKAGRITLAKLGEFLCSGKINHEEYDYIIS